MVITHSVNKTKKAATQFHINQEMKFLYSKRPKLNNQLYKLQFECSVSSSSSAS